MTTPIEHAAEVIAKTFPGWDNYDPDLREAVNAQCMRTGHRIAEALDAAGLIATEQQWGVGYQTRHFGYRVDECKTEASARLHAANLTSGNFMNGAPDATVKVRYTSTTPWKDADA